MRDGAGTALGPTGAARSGRVPQGALDAAVEAVRAAAELCRAVRRTLVADEATAKDDRSPVTVADLGAQAVVSRLLGERFAGIPIVGEEEAGLLRAAPDGPIATAVVRQVREVLGPLDTTEVADAIDRCRHSGGDEGLSWTLDPVDGTKGFLRGGQYTVALALLHRGEPVLGVLGCPNLPIAGAAPGAAGTLMAAVAEAGTWERPLWGADDAAPRTVRVSSDVDRSALRWAESVEAGHSAQGESSRVAALLGLHPEPIRMDSQAKYALVARGEAAVYLRLPVDEAYRERIWDHAAGWLVVREAGGAVTDVDGRDLEFRHGRRLERNRGVLATSGERLHTDVLEAVTRVRAG